MILTVAMKRLSWEIDNYAKDGDEELFTKMHSLLVTNP